MKDFLFATLLTPASVSVKFGTPIRFNKIKEKYNELAKEEFNKRFINEISRLRNS